MLSRQELTEVSYKTNKLICFKKSDTDLYCLLNNGKGQILLIENTKSSNALIGLYQDVTADAAAKMGGKGCVSNQDVRSLILQTDGLTLVSEEEYASGVFRSFVCTL